MRKIFLTFISISTLTAAAANKSIIFETLQTVRELNENKLLEQNYEILKKLAISAYYKLEMLENSLEDSQFKDQICNAKILADLIGNWEVPEEKYYEDLLKIETLLENFLEDLAMELTY